MITTLQDYIKVYKDVLTSEDCDSIISHPKNDETWEESLPVWGTNQNYMVQNRRKCDYIDMSQEGKSYKDIDEMLYNRFSDTIKKYSENTYLILGRDSGYQLLRYKKRGGYIRHVDSVPERQNHICCSILLNDDFGGGELTFFGSDNIDEYTPKLTKGDMIIFPANFMYPYAINSITSGERYSVVTWFV